MTARTYCVRWLMILLTLNLAWVRPVPIDPIPVPAPVPVAICDGMALGDVLGVQLAARQQAVYELLGWGNYDVCQDMFLFIDEDVYGDDPEHVFTGSRHDATPFYFTVRSYTPMDYWSSYGLDQSDADDLCTANAVAGVVHGTLNGAVDFIGLAFSLDDPLGVLPRIRALLIADGGAASVLSLWECSCTQPTFADDPPGLNTCCDIARNNFSACQDTAENTLNWCIDGAAGGGVVAFVLCLIAAMKAGITGGPQGIAAVLVGCSLAGLVTFVGVLWVCYTTYKGSMHNCEIRFNADLNNCYLQYCHE